jgi:hypothetical protein
MPSASSGARRDGIEPVLVVAALALGVYVLVFPFTQARYPPLTDLPFHAAQASILRHYFDPAFHFREQFSIHPLEAPYVSMYVVGALSAFVLPITVASKLMAVSMLALVPAGLAVLLAGMKKNPLWAVLGLGLTWCTLSQWGFLSYMGATGLVAMSAGFALMVVDNPTRARKLLLGASLIVLFFTHVYRFPFAVAAIVLAAWLVFPVTGRFSVLARPLAPGLLLFVFWLAIRPSALSLAFTGLGFHPERIGYVVEHLFGSYWPQEGMRPTAEGNTERAIALGSIALAVLAVVAALVLRSREAPPAPSDTARLWSRRMTLFPLVYAAGLFVLYLTLPLDVGQWFFVYPREIVGVALFLLAAVPEMPRRLPARALVLGLMALAVAPMAAFVSQRFREFDQVTMDFRNVVQAMPRAPRLLYLIYDLRGSQKRASPFLHLPAWIQAEKGGALAFHFARWGFYPVRYRDLSPAVPPPFEERSEWTPQNFDVFAQGPWFDTFLVRHYIEPHDLFDRDPTIHRVAHFGTWWIYRRSR